MASTCVEGAGTGSKISASHARIGNVKTSLLLVTAILPLTLLNGCAGVVSASKTQPVSQGSFQVTPASVSFGKVPVGKATLQSLSVFQYRANIAVNITQATFSNSQFSLSGMTRRWCWPRGKAAVFLSPLIRRALVLSRGH